MKASLVLLLVIQYISSSSSSSYSNSSSSSSSSSSPSFTIFYSNSSSSHWMKYGSIGKSLSLYPPLFNFTLLNSSNIFNDCTFNNTNNNFKNNHVVFKDDIYKMDLFKKCVSDYRANIVALARMIEKEGALSLIIWNYKMVCIIILFLIL